ncbi:MAG TPA: DUF305 domain-containing protein [Ohtaekwangia sp.]|uniref:DUF305 domain-containing protein n=1 Tax=Ohtaekwangia sp. TaxID=2066019 RepID=UPI002F92DAF5
MNTRIILPFLLPAIMCLSVACHDEPDTNNSEIMAIMRNMSDDMKAASLTGDADRDFASMMKMHHQGAIAMANKQLEKGSDAGLKKIARQLITRQTEEVARLDTFLLGHTIVASDSGARFDADLDETMAQMDKSAESQSLKGNIDRDFATLMIMHHVAAIAMAQSILKYGHDHGLKEMAAKMIEDQNEEIEELRNWINNNRQF